MEDRQETKTPQQDAGAKQHQLHISDLDKQEGSMHNGRLGGNFDENVEKETVSNSKEKEQR